MKLYGGSGSASTYTPLLTAAELGILDELDFEIIDMQKGQHKQPAYLAKHPFGKVPSFEDEDTGAAFYECVPCPSRRSFAPADCEALRQQTGPELLRDTS